MSFFGIGNLLSGDKGMGFGAEKAPLFTGTTEPQVLNAYNQSQTGISNQAAFLAALQAQNGIANQSNVFGQQQDLANQFQGVANGTGPNPALQQFQNATGQNVANQAALMASQRGVGANAGLLARQAAMQGAGIQQQAVGQGAALQAQQQLAAMAALQQQQGMMGSLAGQQVAQQGGATTGYNTAVQNQQGNLLNSLNAQNQANVAMQSNMNTSNAAIANTIAGGQLSALGGLAGAAGAAGVNLAKWAGSKIGSGSPIGGSAGGSDLGGYDSAGAATNDTTGAGDFGSPSNDGTYNAFKGGMVRQNYALGGPVNMPESFAGRYLTGKNPAIEDANITADRDQGILNSLRSGGGTAASGGYSPNTNGEFLNFAQNFETLAGRGKGLSPAGGTLIKSGTPPGVVNWKDPGGGDAGAINKFYEPPNAFPTPPINPNPSYIDVSNLEPGGANALGGVGMPGGNYGEYSSGGGYSSGGKVKGSAKKKGDDIKNDTVPAMLSPGEVVIPRHIMMSQDPVTNAAKFVQAILARQRK